MIDRISGRLVMICDECGEGFEEAGDADACPAFFDAFIADAKGNGWVIRPSEEEAGGWSHTCPECAGP